ncbi:unnamed protein product [Cladocopium goreaui]|uniref:Uncharacterized protein n=1 Tax=Cladocopium goreaui TaxID=2562237 RepID=A0A9P1CAP2_9DINO|nr:unnamed protein product [Cladocopium goreaui]
MLRPWFASGGNATVLMAEQKGKMLQALEVWRHRDLRGTAESGASAGTAASHSTGEVCYRKHWRLRLQAPCGAQTSSAFGTETPGRTVDGVHVLRSSCEDWKSFLARRLGVSASAGEARAKKGPAPKVEPQAEFGRKLN